MREIAEFELAIQGGTEKIEQLGARKAAAIMNQLSSLLTFNNR